MKKSFSIIIFITIILVVGYVEVFCYDSNIGNDIGDALGSNVIVKIDNLVIPSFIVIDSAVVFVDNLKNYGFDVIWDGEKREATIIRDLGKEIIPIIQSQAKKQKPGKKEADVFSTDIRINVGNEKIQPVVINGKAAIEVKGLDYFGKLNWDDKSKVLSLTKPTIVNIDEIKNAVQLNEKLHLPQKVSAKLSDGNMEKVSVKWECNDINTSLEGIYRIEGKVHGYIKPITLALSVQKTISLIDDMKLDITQNETFMLPTAIRATMINGNVQLVDVQWDISFLGTQNIGLQHYEGIVLGYDKRVKLQLNIKKGIVEIENKNITLTAGDIYSLPTKLRALMSDGVYEDLDVTWTSSNIDTNKLGIYRYTGIVNNYKYHVMYILTVESDLHIVELSPKDGIKMLF